MSSTPSVRTIEQPPAHKRAFPLALVAVGGAFGAFARYVVGALWPHYGRFDWPILLINCLGAALLGGLLEALSKGGPDEGQRHHLRLFIGTGFCGAFTTYSTFAHDVVALSHRSSSDAVEWGVAQVALGFCFAVLGAWLGSRFPADRRGARL